MMHGSHPGNPVISLFQRADIFKSVYKCKFQRKKKKKALLFGSSAAGNLFTCSSLAK